MNTLSGLGKLLLFSVLLTAVGCAGQDTPTKVPPVTPTAETGSGKLHINLQKRISYPMGVFTYEMDGTIPITIFFKPGADTASVHGEGQANVTASLTNPACQKNVEYHATFEYDVTGTLVSSGGLTADKGNGCYMLVNITEVWPERVETSGTCYYISALVSNEAGYETTYGPYRLDLVKGLSRGEDKLEGKVSDWGIVVKVEELDLPYSTGCVVGEVGP